MPRTTALSLALLLGLAAPLRADPPTATLTLRVAGFRNAKGQALVRLYDKADGWLKRERALRALRLPIAGDKVVAAFEGIPPGAYALSVIHDENMNDKMDMRWLPPGPAEGTAVSRDAKGRLGPPSFKDAVMEIPAGPTEVLLTVRY